MRQAWIGMVSCCLLFSLAGTTAQALGLRAAHRRYAGTLVDYTNNQRADRRIWSPSLGAHRDLYVYLPPGFDPERAYPLMIWLHGIAEDENSFPDDGLHEFDAAMACGRMPPTIIAMPDGSYDGRNRLSAPRPMFLNSNLGDFEDYVADDVWHFVGAHYPILPQREAHILGGFSGGGAAAYRIAIKHRDRFGIVFAGSPPLNPRWINCHGRYFGNFDPDCWGWRTDVRNQEIVGRFYGVVKIRLGKLLYPLYGEGPQALQALSRENPIEMLDAYDVRPGELSMLVAYGGKDQFNIDAQVESFIYHARQRGLDIKVLRAAWGGHNLRLSERFFPQIITWLAPQIPSACPPPIMGHAR